MADARSSTSQPRHHLFLCGVGRSGTTILRRSLGLHQEIYYEGKENNLIQDVLTVARDNCTLASRKFAMTVDQATYDAAFRRLVQDLVWPDPQGREKPVWMAAINPTEDLMDYLCQVFPETRILAIVRNGIEVVASRMQHRAFGKLDFESHCRTWTRTRGIIQWGQRHPEQFQLLRHEWFYDENRLEPAIRELLRWLGLPFEKQVVLNFSQSMPHPSRKPSAKKAEIMSSAQRREYFESQSKAWQAWTEAQQQTFRSICEPFMRELGYSIPKSP